MKSIVKTALTLSMLLPLTGCWDFGWSKKEQKHEQGQAPMNHASEQAAKESQCSHKGCTHDHSKDGGHHNDHSKKAHHNDVKVQDYNDDEDFEDMDVATQSMDMDDDYADENYGDDNY